MFCMHQLHSDDVELREAFKIFDTDNNGIIDAEDICLVMSQLGQEVSQEDVDNMVRETNENKNNTVNYKGEYPFHSLYC